MTFSRSTVWPDIAIVSLNAHFVVSAFFFIAGATVVEVSWSLQYSIIDFGFPKSQRLASSYYFIDEDDSQKPTTSNTSKVVESFILSKRKPCWNYAISSVRSGHAKPLRRNGQSLPRNRQWSVPQFVKSKNIIGIEMSPSFCLCTCLVRRVIPDHFS